MINLSDQQQERYLRNILIPEIGKEGQACLLKQNILIIGAGGLGSAASIYLAANGIGNITIVDHDEVEISNLQRQIIHNIKNLGQKKVLSAKEKIDLLNSDVNCKALSLKISKDNLMSLIKEFEYVIDCTDNFKTRFIINEVCHLNSKTLISSAVKNFSGQLSIFKSYLKDQPCYYCFNSNGENIEDLPLNEKGILGSVPGIMGAMQASIAINDILKLDHNLTGKILICDFLKFSFRVVKINKNPTCKICSR